MIINLFSNSQINTLPGNTPVDSSNSIPSDESMSNGQKALSLLSSGDTISGQIVSLDGNKVSVSLGNNSLITALLDTNAELPLGSNISFSVRTTNSGNLTLTPLMTNLNTTSAVSQALNAAGLLLDERNVKMVESMMKEGMSIGKDELLNLSKGLGSIEINDIPQAVLLTKLGIEPTNDNLLQFNAYLGYEHQVSGAVDSILSLLPDTMSDIIDSGALSDALQFVGDIIDVFTNEGAMLPMDDNTLTLSDMNTPVSELLSESETLELSSLLEQSGLPEEFTAELKNGNVNLQEFMLVIKQASTEELETLSQDLKPDNNNIQDKTTDNKLNATLINQTQLPDEDEFTRNSISDLLKSKVFTKLLKDSASNQWKLTPDQVGEEKQVTNLYKRITEQTTRLIEILDKNAKSDTPLAEQTKELGKNINFMNELNNMFDYVQLPMKLSGNDAHGELYVYSNKKHLGNEDGTVSALLHLDMDNLGPTDVYVTMNSSNNVNTHFYLKDDEALDLIANHIDELNARIESRGYNCKTEVSHRDEMTNIMSSIVEDNKSNIPISISGFDAKA